MFKKSITLKSTKKSWNLFFLKFFITFAEKNWFLTYQPTPQDFLRYDISPVNQITLRQYHEKNIN